MFTQYITLLLLMSVVSGGSFLAPQNNAEVSGVAARNLSLVDYQAKLFDGLKNILRAISGDEKKVNLLFAGDIQLSRAIGKRMENENDYLWSFRLIASTTREADIMFGNLEGPISDKGSDLGGLYSFRADPRSAAGLEYAGFDIVSVANNHIGDWGREALADTLSTLEKYGIKYVGGGRNKEEAHTVKIIESHGMKFGFLAYNLIESKHAIARSDSAGITESELDTMMVDISKAKEVSDMVVASFHFGGEYQDLPNREQRKWAESAIEAGASIVVGHHSHVVQPVELYQSGYIAYSLGNFIFDQNFSDKTMRGMMLSVTVKNGKIIAVESIETKISDAYQVYTAN